MQPIFASFLFTLASHAAELEPSRLVYGRVDLNAPSLPPWYLKSLTAAGVSDLILPGYYASRQEATGPIELWTQLTQHERDDILLLASSKSNRILMQVELPLKALTDSDISGACQKAADFGLDGIVFSSALTPSQAVTCSHLIGAVIIASPEQIETVKGATVFQLKSNAQVSQGQGDFLALCEGGVCPSPDHVSEKAVVYLNVLPAMADRYLKDFLETDLPKFNGMFDSNDRPLRPSA